MPAWTTIVRYQGRREECQYLCDECTNGLGKRDKYESRGVGRLDGMTYANDTVLPNELHHVIANGALGIALAIRLEIS